MIKKSFGASLQTTDTTLYEVPAGKKAEWVLLYATDVGGSTTNFSVDIYDSSADATLGVLNGYSLASNDFFKLGGEPNAFTMLYEGDQIKARCASNDAVTLLISVIEHNEIIKGG